MTVMRHIGENFPPPLRGEGRDVTWRSAPTPSRAGVLPLIGSELAFDFTNTSSGRGGPRHIDHLRTPEHLLIRDRHRLRPQPAAAQ